MTFEVPTFDFDIKKHNENAMNNAMTADQVPQGDTYVQNDTDWVSNVASPEQIKAWQQKGAIGWGEAWSRLDKLELVPFVNGLTLLEEGKVLGLINKKNKGEHLTETEQVDLKNYLTEMAEMQTRGYSWGGKFAEGLGMTIPFVGEFVATGGLMSLGKAGAKKVLKIGAKEAIEEMTKKGVKQFAKKTAQTVARSGARTVLMPHQVAKRYADSRINDSVAITDKGKAVFKEATEKPATTAMKAFGDVWIENFSEEAGELVLKPLFKGVGGLSKKLLKEPIDNISKKMSGKAIKALNKLSLEKQGITFKKLVKKFGYDGALEELGEERIGDILRTSFDLDEKEGYSVDQYMKAVFPDAEQLLLELGMVTVHGSMSRSGAYLFKKFRDKGMSKKEALGTVQEMSEEEKEFVIKQIDEIESAEEKTAFEKSIMERSREFVEAGVEQDVVEQTMQWVRARTARTAEKTGMKRYEILDEVVKKVEFRGDRPTTKKQKKDLPLIRISDVINKDVSLGGDRGKITRDAEGFYIFTDNKGVELELGKDVNQSLNELGYDVSIIPKREFSLGDFGEHVTINRTKYKINEIREGERGLEMEVTTPRGKVKTFTDSDFVLAVDIERNKLYTREQFAKEYPDIPLYQGELFQEGMDYNQEGKIIENENFKNWFGDSKVVDEKGDPLVVYHGTGAKVENDFAFDPRRISSRGSALGYGFYLTDDKDIASGYLSRDGGTVIEAFVRLEKPLSLETKLSKKEAKKIISELVDLEIELYADELPNYKDGFLSNIVDTYSLTKKEAVDEATNELYDKQESAIDFIAGLSNLFGDKITASKALYNTLGYDGVLVENFQESDATVYVPFFPESIKSVDNQGTFSTTDANIFKQNGEKKIRGAYNPDTLTIALTEKADRSTISHELMHGFINFDLRYDPEGFNALANIAGVNKAIDQLTKADITKIQETGAEMFEQYLREGKAPTAQLETVFEKFKAWLSELYKDLKSFNFKLTDEARAYFDETLTTKGVKTESKKAETKAFKQLKQDMLSLGVDEEEIKEFFQTITEEGKTIEQAREEAYQKYSELRYSEILNYTEEKPTFIDKSKEVIKAANTWKDYAIKPLSSALNDISPKLKKSLRDFVINGMLVKNERNKRITPFLEKYNELSEDDKKVINYALKANDYVKASKIKGMKEPLKQVRELLEEIYKEGQEVGLDMGYIKDYFPTMVKKPVEYLRYLKKQDSWTMIEQQLQEADPEGTMSVEERAAVVNTITRGFNRDIVALGKPSGAKARTVLDITPELSQFYEDSSQSLIRYINNMTEAINARKFFGKSDTSLEGSIGMVINELIETGEINAENEQKARELLTAMFKQGRAGKMLGAFRDFTYITLLGSPISAVTQIEDIGVTAYKTGIANTSRGLIDAIAKDKGISIDDLGIENIAEEFKDVNKSKKIIETMFKATGFSYMDRIGKESFVNATYQKYKKSVDKPEFKQEMSNIFGTEAGQVIEDIKNGTMSDNVKYLLINELLEIQPIAISEMPMYYVKGGSSKAWYVLKSFTLRRLDFVVNETFRQMKTDPKKGLTNLVRLSFFLMLSGATTDFVKDLILGREPDPSDYLVNNFIKMFGFGKWMIYKARQEGLATAIAMNLLPPFSLPDNLYKDLRKLKNIKDWRIIQNMPIAGKIYYWRWGGGDK